MMKFNLKNRPKTVDEMGAYVLNAKEIMENPLSVYRFLDKIEAWFEGFEKEIRRKLTEEKEKWLKATHPWNEIIHYYRIKLLSEILGECPLCSNKKEEC